MLGADDHWVGAILLQEFLAGLENEVDAFERDNQRAWVLAFQDRANRLDYALLVHDCDLFGRCTGSRVREAPDCLLLEVQGGAGHHGDDLVDQANVNAPLDLLRVARRHV